MSRTTKRASIISVYFAIVVAIVGIVTLANKPVPSCTDGVRNQSETGVDCGGSCTACLKEIRAKDIIIEDIALIFGGPGRYDVLATVRNPNPSYGAADVTYTVTLVDDSGRELLSEKKKGFILPTQERYFPALSLASDVVPAKANVQINTVEWVEFAGFEDPDFSVQNLSFGLVKDGSDFAQIFGLVRNKSTFDFLQVDVLAVLKDERGTPIAVNQTAMGAFDAGQARDFQLPWPYRFPGEIAKADVQIFANVFDSQNFVSKYLPGGRFENVN